jgi:hypothetical protein
MALRRRFIFRGNAAAVGGRIVRPADTIIDSTVASSLTVAGGRSRAQATATRFGQFVSFGTAATLAEGVFDNVQQQIELSFGRVDESALTMTTRVSADATALSVGDADGPKFTAKHVRASLTSKSPAGSGEPPIDVGSDTVIETAAVDQFGLIITLAPTVFQTLDTLAKISTAVDDPTFIQNNGSHFFMTPRVAGAPTPPTRLVASRGTTYATIVKSIKWATNPFPGSTIDNNVVTVPGLGKIFFGELLITGQSRRLTMIRMELGSPIGGFVAWVEVETNGIWST